MDVVTVRESRAVVHAPNDLTALRAKIRAYANEDTTRGKPRYQDLIARLDTIEPATIEDLSLGEIEQSILDDERIWVEIWMPGGRNISDDEREDLDRAVQEFAALNQASSGHSARSLIPVYRGPERDVHLVPSTGAMLKALPVLLPSAVEVHRAPQVRPVVLAEAADEAGERATVEQPSPVAAAIALHDSGITDDHPYLQPILLGASSVVPGAPAASDTADGHGTQMAGVAAYSRLAEDLVAGRLHPDAWLVSVRLLESKNDIGGDPDREPLWAERTTESIATAEALAPQRTVIHSISLGADIETRGRDDRTAWSVAADVLGWNSGLGRVLLVAAGNADAITDRAAYPFVNLGPPHLQQPGQAWNVLTVGGYTNLDELTEQDREGGYAEPLATAGELSPHSRTAPGGNRPLKPDLVMEAGNTAPGGGLESPEAQGLTILTLENSWREGTLLRHTWATSPAAAAVSNALARIANAHPELRPATWRGLLVHTTRWPQVAREQFSGQAKLFHTMQLLVATNGDKAVLGSITSGPEHYTPWRDPYPLSTEELSHRLKKRKAAISQQDILAGVVLHPVRLLDITHNYVSFMQTDDGKTIKALPRYQQYRAVSKAIDRLQTGKTRQQDGEKDRRGGVIWHTQGSGKSLTMSFLVRKTRTVPGLRKTKIVIVTDRTQLQDQLSKTLELAGEKVDTTRKMVQARRLLSQHGPGIVCVMIQKQQDDAEMKKNVKDADIIEGKAAPRFPLLNADESVVLLIDEAHRSHASKLHGNLMAALPNCARIGFTGTPILMGEKKRTTGIFGEYIDVYRLADAERDEAVVPILYSGRTVKGAVRDGRDMDEVFEDMLADHTPEEMEQIKRRYAAKGDVMEADELIGAKANNMLRHYVETVLPNGFKAQVAAHSRRAAIRYRHAFVDARDELVAQIENLPTDTRNADPETLKNRRIRFLVGAAARLDELRKLDFIPVISAGTTNDEKYFEPWTDPDKQQRVIDDFKNPAKPPAFLIVKSMLLTGFDAPIEQVLYLDRGMKEAELLQAIARVNRPAAGLASAKKCGYVIDYVGVTNHLTKALKAYADEDIEGVFKKLEIDQVANLRTQLARVLAVFTDSGITPGTSDEAMEDCVELLADGPLRDRFEGELHVFLSTVDTVMPMPQAGPFLPAAKLFTEIAKRVRRRYRETGDFDPSLYGEKVRELIDEHMTSLGVETILPPISITDPDYQAKVAKFGPRARASEMEHAIRHHISLHMDEDPTRYRRLSERLEQILADHRGNWEQQAFALAEFLEKIKTEDAERDGGDPYALNRVESALYNLLVAETATDGAIDQQQGQRLAGFSRQLYELAAVRTTRKDFWRHPVDQDDFTKEVTVTLITDDVCPSDEAPALADKLFEIIKANKGYIEPPD